MSTKPAPSPFTVFPTTIKHNADGTYSLDPSIQMSLGDAVQIFADDNNSYELTVSIKQTAMKAGSVNVHS